MPEVDGIRALAVLLVLCTHFVFFAQFYVKNTFEHFNQLSKWIGWTLRGDLGVDMFFVISGFLIGGILLHEYKQTNSLRLKRFFIRRFMRLMPAYWWVIFATAVVMLIRGPSVFFEITIEPNIEWIWTNLLYVNNFLRSPDQFMPLAHSWSLAVEEQFYFICPFLILFFFRTKLRLHPVKFVISAFVLYLMLRGVARWYSLQELVHDCGYKPEEIRGSLERALLIARDPKMFCAFSVEIDVVYDNLYTKFIALFVGVMIAYLKVFKEEAVKSFFAKKNLANTVGLVALLAFAFSFVDEFVISHALAYGIYQTFFYQMVFSVALAYLILLAIYGRGFVATPLKKFLSAKFWYPIAQLSYVIYLTHVGNIGLVYEQFVAFYPDATLGDLLVYCSPVVFGVTLVSCSLIYLLIERPIMNLRSVFEPSKSD